MKTAIIAFSMIILLLQVLHAQIVVTMEDDRPVLESTRSTIYYGSDVAGTTFSLGGPGAGKTFDLTVYTFSSSPGTGMGARPMSASPPFNAATHISTKTYGNYPTWFFITDYYTLNPQGRYYLGKNSDWPEQGSNSNIVWTPPGIDYPFPCTLGSRWSDDVVVDSYDYSTGLKTGSGTAWRTASVEAAGLLRLPMGDYDCLRIKRKERREFGRSSFHEFVTNSNIRVVMTVDTLDEDSDTPRIRSIVITQYNAPTGVQSGAASPGVITLLPNYPNPFMTSTTIQYFLPKSCSIRLSVCDAMGREIAVMAHGFIEAGAHSVQWNATDCAGNTLDPGVYFCRLVVYGPAGGMSHRTGAMLVIR